MLKLFNSLTNKKEEFKPISSSRIGIYSCGPTVYDHVHIGNLRSFLIPDLLQRVLRYLEQKDVEWVMNITDIDDKMIDRSKKDFPSETAPNALLKLADKYTEIFLQDIERVGIKRDDISHLPRATEYVNIMQKIIIGLVAKGIAYISEGSIYFSIEKYRAMGQKYGVLADLDFDSRSRVTDDQDQKEGVADFALWKAKKQNEPYWDFMIDGKNYQGRPGWHIECSAMSTELLGRPFDIHTGGVDLRFPHHENELAQCEGIQANYYLHIEHLNINSQKMSKSVGNVKKISEISDPAAFRYLVMSGHYRSQMDFNLEDLNSANERILNIRTYTDQLMLARVGQLPAKDESGAVDKFIEEFKSALEDDLNTPKALAALSIIEGKIYSEDAREAMRLFDNVLGLQISYDVPLHDVVLADIDKYTNARYQKKFGESDQLRIKILDDYKLKLSDTPIGTLVSRAK